jgi:uncharacterized protein YndB with AHSA1/START domain
MPDLLQFSVTRVLHASSRDVWRVLGDFGNEHRWTQSLSHCERNTREVRVGTARRCRLPKPLMGRSEVHEVLTEFEPERALAYALDGPAGPFASAFSRWSVQPVSAGATAVTIAGRFEPKNWMVRLFVWPLAKPMLKRLTTRVLGELELFVAPTAQA